MVGSSSICSKLALAALCTAVLLGSLLSSSASATVGVVPPRKPAADCATSSESVSWDLAGVDVCRAKEGVGPMTLPSNWSSLSTVEQMFVVIDLERVNRGEHPIIGLSTPLSRLVQRGAVRGTDPSFPGGGFIAGGGIWAAAFSVIGADDSWMYYDGPHGLDLNLACGSPGDQGCWLHRDIILWRGTGGPLVGGGGFSTAPGYDSYAFEVLSGYSTAHLTFTWAHELHYFAQRPKAEPLHGFTARARHHRKRRHDKRTSGKPSISIG